MKNITMSVAKNILTIQVDLSKDQGVSKSGKNKIIATTSGNAEVPGLPAGSNVKIGLNIYKPA